jgi:DNA-directed RNA polymerase specialized sigma54-like protein
MSENHQIEKTISQQVIDKMIEKIKSSGYFTDDILEELKSTDLSNKLEVKRVISTVSKTKQNENTETGN